MACQEHKDLANTIKETHVKLRKAAKREGGDTAWELHLKNESELKEYASAMHKLATEYWDKNEKNVSRIQWVVTQCMEYFKNGGHMKAKLKEELWHRVYFNEEIVFSGDSGANGEQVCLLDVGSCYNPFKKFDLFDVVLAIDLSPATVDVLKCDFLNVDVVFDLPAIPFRSPCRALPANSFDVVVFSLLLEYFPCNKQRWICCQKAYKLLKSNGLLIIITPDSKHATANAKLIRNWRLALASLGFTLLKYEKQQHLHCLAYRKCFNQNVATHWLSLQKSGIEIFEPENMINIPQDLNEHNELENSDPEVLTYDRDSIVNDFSEVLSSDFEI